MNPAALVTCGLALCLGTACARSATAPAVPSFAGVWEGTGTNHLGNHGITLSLTQDGTTLSGSVMTRAADPVGTTCASCHMQKTGRATGTVSGRVLSLVLTFPSGDPADPTPHCATTITMTHLSTTPDTLAGPYGGHDTCEGPFTNASLVVTRR